MWSLAINPLTPTTMYAGTRGGVFRSTDGGDSWSSANNGLTDRFVYCLAIDPATPTTLYAGTYGPAGGMFRSMDGGTTWTALSFGTFPSQVLALAIDPLAPTTLYAANTMGIFRSIDRGDHWVAINNGLTNTFVRCLAIDPHDSSLLFAGTDGGVFRSMDSGDHWTAVNSGFSNTYIRILAVDHRTPTTLYAVGNGLYRSMDNGDHWTAVPTPSGEGISSLAIYTGDFSVLYLGTADGEVFHSSVDALAWAGTRCDPDGQSISCLAISPTSSTALHAGTNGGGLFRSTDSGGHWTSIDSGLAAQMVGSIAVNPLDPTVLYAGTYDDGVHRSTDSGANWATVKTGPLGRPGSVLAVDPLTPSTVYAGGWGEGVSRSTDGGDHWVAVNDGLTSTYVECLAIDPRNPSVLLAGTNYGGIFRSTDSGDHWTAVNTGLTNMCVTCLAIDHGSPGTMYAGTPSMLSFSGSSVAVIGGLFRSTDGGAHWVAINEGLRTGCVSCIAVDPATPSTLYVCGNGVFRSVDSGNTWVAVNNGLGSMSVKCLAIDPHDTSTLFAGTDSSGVFKSTDGGSHWSSLNNGLSDQRVVSLAIDPSTPSKLYAGTEGSGIFRTNGATSCSLATNCLPSEGGSIARSPDRSSYTLGTFVQLTARPNPGWHFTCWLGDVAGAESTVTIAIDADKTVAALFERDIERVIELKVGSSMMLVDGSPVSLEAVPIVLNSTVLSPIRQIVEAIGGTFAWEPSNGKVTIAWRSTALELVIGQQAARVNGQARLVDSNGSTPILVGGIPFVPLRFVSEVFRMSSAWKPTGEITLTYYPVTMSTDLTTGVVGSGSVGRYPDLPRYEKNTVVCLTATPLPGWHFVNWSGDLTGSMNPTWIVMWAAKTVVANFAVDAYETTVSAGLHGTIVPGTGSIPYHATRDYDVNPDAGYVVEAVTVDGVLQNDAAGRHSYVVTLKDVEGPHTLAATFRRVPDSHAPTITLSDLSKMAGVIGWSGGTTPTFTVRTSPFMLMFTVNDDSGSAKWTITVNGVVVIDPVGTGSVAYPIPLAEGRNDVDVSASDAAGNYSSQKLVIYLDSTGPVLEFSPALPTSVTSPNLIITGSATDAVSGLRSLSIDGTEVVPFLDGSFRGTLTLAKGLNKIVIEAEDNSGNRSSRAFTVAYTPPSLPAAKTITLTIGKAAMDVDGMAVDLDAAPVIQNGRTMLPLRPLIEVLGGTTSWNARTKTAVAALGSRSVSVTIGNPVGLVGGKKVPVDLANAKVVPLIVNGRTFLPLRFIAQNLGLDLAWEPVSQTVSLTYWP